MDVIRGLIGFQLAIYARSYGYGPWPMAHGYGTWATAMAHGYGPGHDGPYGLWLLLVMLCYGVLQSTHTTS